MRSNSTILEQNTLLGFEHFDSQELYLRGAQKNELRAFWMACEWQDKIRPFLQMVGQYYRSWESVHPGYEAAHRSAGEAFDEVIEFVKERQFRRYFPNQ